VSEHLSDQVIELYRRRMMPPRDLLAANDHIAVCDACYRQVGQDDRVEATYAFVRANLEEVESPGADHPAYEQIAAYVDNGLDGERRRAFESHLGSCQQCETEVSDLSAIRENLRSFEVPAPQTAPPFRERLAALWHLPAYRAAFQIAGAAVIAALVVWVATASLRNRVADLQTQLGHLRQENDAIRQKYESAESAVAELKAQIDSSRNSSGPFVVALNDGDRRVTLDEQGDIGGLESFAPSYRQMIKTALTAQRVTPPPVLAKLAGKPRSLMGGPAAGSSFTLLGPVGTVVESDRPAFHWSELSGAAGYIVAVYDSNFREAATSPLLSATEWRPPLPLKRGGIYVWQVRALKDGDEIRIPPPDSPDAKFKILERTKAEELESAKQSHADSHLLLGLLYAKAGLLDSAEREFQVLVETNPKSQVAQNLLQSVKSLRQK
jgi:anti-sigma factor RsiW